jgi:biopolymer transport protein ExbD
MKFQKKSKVAANIPTASMPDIIFLLLLFFMITTVFKLYPGLRVRLPDAELVKKIPGSKRHVVSIWIDRNKQVVCDDYKVEKVTNLRTFLYEKRSKDPQILVALKVDKESTMGMVSDVQEEMRKAYTLKVNYAALREVY